MRELIAALAVYALNTLRLSPAVLALLSTFAALGGLVASLAAPAILRQFGIGKTRILAGVACLPAVALTLLAPALTRATLGGVERWRGEVCPAAERRQWLAGN